MKLFKGLFYTALIGIETIALLIGVLVLASIADHVKEGTGFYVLLLIVVMMVVAEIFSYQRDKKKKIKTLESV